MILEAIKALCAALTGLALISGPSLAAELALVKEIAGAAFEVSGDGETIAVIGADRICLHSSVGDVSSCFASPLQQGLHMNGQLRWSPSGSQLAISGPESHTSAAVWIADVSGLRSSIPVRIYSTGAPGPGVGHITAQYWIDDRNLIVSIGRSGYRLLNLASGDLSGCSWTEIDGDFRRLADAGLLIGSNRFGDVMIARERLEAGRAQMLCDPERHPRSTPDGVVWNQFEDRLGNGELLFSEQVLDRGTRWRIGAKLGAYDAATLEFVKPLPDGAPASVSPNGELVAALRHGDDGSTRVHIYRAADYLSVLERLLRRYVPSNSLDAGVIVSGHDWADLRPKWSPGNRYLLIDEPAAWGAPAVHLISLADGSIETILEDFPGALSVDWTSTRRLAARSPTSLRIYEVVE